MKWIWCTMWILGAFLVIGMLDAVPDPPAVNPSTALSGALQRDSCACDTVAPRCDCLDTSYPVAVSLLAADACEPQPSGDRLVLTRQAADSSPPAPQAIRKTFQS